MPSIEVTKHVVAADGVAETGKFDLTVDDAVKANDVGNGGTTGSLAVGVGDHTVAEKAGTGTSLSDYSSHVECVNGASKSEADGTSLKLTVALGDQWKCTVTNTRKPATVEPTPTPGGSEPGATPGEGTPAGDGPSGHTPTGDGPSGPASSPVRLTSLRIAPKRVALFGPHRGARVTWSVSDKAIVTLTLQRAVTGRRVGSACRPATRANRSRPSCRRFVALAGVARQVAAGAGSLKLGSELRRQAPAAGRLSAGGHGCRRCDGAALCGSDGDLHRREASGLSRKAGSGRHGKAPRTGQGSARTRTRTDMCGVIGYVGRQACQGAAADGPRATRVPGV